MTRKSIACCQCVISVLESLFAGTHSKPQPSVSQVTGVTMVRSQRTSLTICVLLVNSVPRVLPRTSVTAMLVLSTTTVLQELARTSLQRLNVQREQLVSRTRLFLRTVPESVTTQIPIQLCTTKSGTQKVVSCRSPASQLLTATRPPNR